MEANGGVMPKTDPTQEMVAKEIDRAVAILREDAQLAHNAALMDRLDKLESRIPGKELSAEEKAAEYDKLMAERNKPPTDPPTPPTPPKGGPKPPEPKPEPPADPPKRKDFWFGEIDE
jgi:hypothetical protein